ncbi:MAG: carboxylesterase family protein [Lachnospiraceae bacterium]|nr:carboxylesterase family protein [Lachnospiraceae bacterium]
MENNIKLATKCGDIIGLQKNNHLEFLGVKYANANRFEYCTLIDNWSQVTQADNVSEDNLHRLDETGTYLATHHGDACIQKRIWYEHLEHPVRRFYHKEFRENIEYHYSEDCLNLDIYTPSEVKKDSNYPVIVFIHGGGFDSGCNYDTAIDGSNLAQKGVICVSINYRVGIFGYLTHQEIYDKYGRQGNFGLDDQFMALKWIKENISAFGGDNNNITVMGQSAGAISIQYLVLNEKCKGLFNRVVMMSGAGLFPKFALPRKASSTNEYWDDLIKTMGLNSFEELKSADPKAIFDALEILKGRRKDNTYNTMPVVDGYLIEAPVDTIINKPLNLDYMIGYTNNDMYASIMAHIGNKFAKSVGAYVYYFDIDTPGKDDNRAFHSSDIRYIFGTLNKSHRLYKAGDYMASELMMNYLVAFAKKGDPNHEDSPTWIPAGNKPLHLIRKRENIDMGKPNQLKLLYNTLFKGDPKDLDVTTDK